MTFGKVNGVREPDYFPQEIRAGAEALDDARHLLPPGRRAPEVISLGGRARCLLVLDDSNLRCRECGAAGHALDRFIHAGPLENMCEGGSTLATMDDRRGAAIVVRWWPAEIRTSDPRDYELRS